MALRALRGGAPAQRPPSVRPPQCRVADHGTDTARSGDTVDDPAALLARALHLDDDAEQLRRAAAHLHAVAQETPGVLAAPRAGLTVEVWQGQAAGQAREQLATTTARRTLPRACTRPRPSCSSRPTACRPKPTTCASSAGACSPAYDRFGPPPAGACPAARTTRVD